MTSISATMSDPRAGPPAPTTGKQPATATAAQPAASHGIFDRAALTAPKQVTVELPEISAGKLHLSVDDETGRVVGRIIDRESGELLWQLPSDDMLRLIAATEKMLGPIYSTEA